MSIVVNGELVKNNKHTGIKTVVKSIRAEKSFFDKCNLIAKSQGITCNKLIVKVVSQYCEKVEKDTWKEKIYSNDKILVGK